MSKFAFFHSPSEKSHKKIKPQELLSPKLRSAWIPVSGPGFGLDRYQVQESFAPENLKPDHMEPEQLNHDEDLNVSVTVPVMPVHATIAASTATPRVYSQPENAFVNLGSWEESWVMPPVFESASQPESLPLAMEQPDTTVLEATAILTEPVDQAMDSIHDIQQMNLQSSENSVSPDVMLYQEPLYQEPLNLEDLFPPDHPEELLLEESVVTIGQAPDPSQVIWEQVVCQVSPPEQADDIPLQMISAEPELEVVVLEPPQESFSPESHSSESPFPESPFQYALEESAWELPSSVEVQPEVPACVELACDAELDLLLPMESFLTIPQNSLPLES